MLDPSARRRSLDRRLQNLDLSLQRLLVRQESLTAPALLLASRCHECSTILRTSLNERWHRGAKYPEKERNKSRTRLCQDIGRVVTHIVGELIPLIEASKSESIPIELLPALERQIKSA